ncbi:MAG: PHP domain-containing protein [Gammaproteobacteria bacterium]|nr:PHP domain-containing protein [Gammaproteobacteria bacterium]
MKYDLHSHSIASDGTLTPTALVHEAVEEGVTHLALTDHDTLAGLPEARQAVAGLNIELIAGAELSAMWNGRTIHIVGLHLDVESSVLREGIRQQLEFRDWRGREIARRLEKKAGIEDAYEGALSFVHGGLVSRTHFARYLVEAGYAKDFGQAFKKYLLKGKPGHVRGDWASLADVVEWIRAADGIAVLAHPARYNLTATRLRGLLAEFIEAGGEAIEVLSGSHTPNEVKAMAGHALRFGLLASAGSDYHGPENPWVHLGRLPEMPESCTAVWDSDIWQQRAA